MNSTANQQPATRQSVLTMAVAQSLAVKTIESLNATNLGEAINAGNTYKDSIRQMVQSQLQDAIATKA